ncbi:ATP-grasp fold amidoligase family protein [Parabacteroides goldsteinii]|uniref:ATP-grasp fold amidoligase family protein n=1 Tax=Parabacteroides goldsteinii TaxID=328812 RepID=UPI001899EE55|nr:ATP-grasp fold amidoligase family protein [Parabacteroides goldsteinii]
MIYKKIIPNRHLRLTILRKLEWIPDTCMIYLQYWIHTGRILSFKNPKRYTEKIQHYKCFYRNLDMKRCVDKYEVREYLKERGFEKYLNKLYGVYNSVFDINFDLLPQSFVIKTTDGGGNTGVFICRDKNSIKKQNIIDKFGSLIDNGKKSPGREWAYYGIKRQIIVEQLLINNDRPNIDIDDYKFLCFNGKVKYIWIDIDRNICHKRNFYDTNWKKIDVECEYPTSDKNITPPPMLSEMIDLAEKLSKDFPHVRVDLYNVNHKIIFGELTFYSSSGYTSFIPDNFDFELGKLFDTKYIQQ